MSQPSELPEWNSGAANSTTPSGGKKVLGYTVNEVPLSGHLNWFMRTTYLWANYLKGLVAGTEIFTNLVATASSGVAVVATGGATQPGMESHGGSGNSHGFFAYGSGTGYGALGKGGLTGEGIRAVGGDTSGAGLIAIAVGGNSKGVDGTGVGSAAGVQGTGGASAGVGVKGVGGAGGSGVYGQGTSNGKGGEFQGNGTGHGVEVTSGSGGAAVPVVATRGDGSNTDVVLRADGYVHMNGGNPGVTASIQNRITPLSFLKAWVTFTCNGTANPTIVAGLNVTSVVQTVGGGLNGLITITIAGDMAGVSYGLMGVCESVSQYGFEFGSKAAGSFIARPQKVTDLTYPNAAATDTNTFTIFVVGAQ
jgi:hypothetical protein